MNKYLGFHGNMFGDLAMGTTAAAILKRTDPDSHLTYIIGNDFADFAPLLLNSPDIDRIYVTCKGKDGFNLVDQGWINDQKFNHIFDPMSDHDHSRPWFRERHQALELAFMHKLPIVGESNKIVLKKWFKESKDFGSYVAFSPFPAWYAGIRNDKALSLERAQKISSFINDLGFGVLQVGHPDEPMLDGVLKLRTTYFESVKNILGCRMMVMGDSGLNWVLSAYDFPLLGLYSHRYYGPTFVKNIQPNNASAQYLDAPNVNDIPLEKIFEILEHRLA